ncbi:ArnT family glycosyltransferase [Legionella taurinensis]|nr:glycosyltransferase family 39 protein [Legionella taurinensis]MDX1836639.1 glycosyltransferase family 39 protein [Legionella taurinensis]STY26689.1 dolichyl-phosphate-mannose-protein mannosyltransferase [Legionella taurinensis]
MSWPRSVYYWVLLGFSLLVFLPGIAKLPVIDRDEAHFAQATRQMLQTNNYFQVRFQERTRFQKPPGINWLQAASLKLTGHGDSAGIWPYRLPSFLGALLSVLLTFAFASRFVSFQTAGMAAALLASSLLLTVEAHMAVIDASLLSSILLMQGALWIIYDGVHSHRRISPVWPALFWLAMAYGLVLKGVTPLVGVLTVTALCVTERRVAWLKALKIVPGLLLFSGLSLAWLWMLNQAEHSNYLMQMLNKDLLPKLQGGHESHGQPPLFHLALLPLTFWPASLFLWQAGDYALRQRHTSVVRFLLCWIIPTWVFFELMPTKLPQYVLPTFPAIALLAALAIEQAGLLKAPGKWLRWLQGGWLLMSGCLLVAVAMIPRLLNLTMPLVSWLLVSMGFTLCALAVYFARRGHYQRTLVSLVLVAATSYPLIFSQLLPQLKPLWITDAVAKNIPQELLSTEKPLIVAGFDEPSLVFNLNTGLVRFSDSLTAQERLKKNQVHLALVEAGTYQTWPDDGAIKRVATVRGYNYSKGRWVELLLVGHSDKGEG